MHINPWAPPLLLTALIVCICLASEIERPGLATLAALNALVSGVGIVRSVTRGLRPVSAVFFIFTFAWLGVAPIIQIATGVVAWRDISALHDPQRVATALTTILVATVAFLLGTEYARGRAEKRQAEGVLPAGKGTVRIWVLAGITLVGLMLMPMAIQANGGLAALFTSRRELTGLRASMGTSMDVIGGPAYALTRILPGALAVSGALLAIYAIRARWTSFMRIRGGIFLMLVVAVASLALFSNPLANSRFIAAVAFGSLLLALYRPRSTRAGVIFAALMLTITLLIYPLANVFRSETFNVKSGVDAFTSADFDGFQQVINTFGYVEDFGHTWGSQTLSGIGFFVPRSLWEGKADPASFQIAENAGYVFTNLSLPIHAEFYLEFGWVGIIVGMGGIGLLAGRMDHAWLSAPDSKLAMIAPYAALAMLGIIRGPIGSQVPVWGAVVILLMLGIAGGKEASPPTKDAPTSGSQQRAPHALLRAGR